MMDEMAIREARQARMIRLKEAANRLRASMLTVAENDVEFTKVFNTVVHSDIGWDQMIVDLEALAGLARMEE
jgi:hypothetical protein